MADSLNDGHLHWRRRSLRYGIGAGILTVVWIALFHALDRTYALQPAVLLATYVFYLAAMYLAVRPERSGDFKDYLRPAFLVFILANAVYYFYYFLLFTRVDPGLVDLQAAGLEAQGRLGEIGGRGMLELTAWNTFTQYAYSLIGGFALSAVVAFIMRNR